MKNTLSTERADVLEAASVENAWLVASDRGPLSQSSSTGNRCDVYVHTLIACTRVSPAYSEHYHPVMRKSMYVVLSLCDPTMMRITSSFSSLEAESRIKYMLPGSYSTTN